MPTLNSTTENFWHGLYRSGDAGTREETRGLFGTSASTFVWMCSKRNHGNEQARDDIEKIDKARVLRKTSTDKQGKQKDKWSLGDSKKTLRYWKKDTARETQNAQENRQG